ncbi:MAG: THUMP domain-containing protein [Candidatus Ranarchaeia archaeon]
MGTNHGTETVIVRYGEIGLKSEGVRRHFVRLLTKHIEKALWFARLTSFSITQTRGRIFVNTDSPHETCSVLSQWVPGIVSTSPAIRLTLDIKVLSDYICRYLEKRVKTNQTFGVYAKRSVKRGPDSMELQRMIGGKIHDHFQSNNLQVNLRNPDWRIEIESHGDHAYIFFNRFSGLGGMPVGSQKRLHAVFTGSVESILAAWYLLRRGAHISLLIPSSDGQGRLEDMARKLARFTPTLSMKLIMLPLNDLYNQIPETPEYMRWLLQRRILLRYLQRHHVLFPRGIIFEDRLPARTTNELLLFMLSDHLINVPIHRPLLALPDETIEKTVSRLRFTDKISRDFPRSVPLVEKTVSEEELIKTEISLGLTDPVFAGLPAPAKGYTVDAMAFGY